MKQKEREKIATKVGEFIGKTILLVTVYLTITTPTILASMILFSLEKDSVWIKVIIFLCAMLAVKITRKILK